jgi:hypothetical protein
MNSVNIKKILKNKINLISEYKIKKNININKNRSLSKNFFKMIKSEFIFLKNMITKTIRSLHFGGKFIKNNVYYAAFDK